ncbi:MAG: hypothetical protein EXS59_02350 [Candidatus Taylorbacteria bacterium]|nr:hypothetical protein [Candidatus Taylorbacteria bacterium]
MERYTIIKKKVGDTPLQALELFRATKPELKDVPMTYAGRLDPMASGKLLVLIGNECKRRKSYDGLDKEYEFEILFGFKSDTGDVLGMAETFGGNVLLSEDELRRVARSFPGNFESPYPAFSSKTVEGKPLFHHAVENNLGDITIPMTKSRIYHIVFCGMREVTVWELIQNVVDKISLLHVDESDTRVGSGFRKNEIVERWRTFQGIEEKRFLIAKFRTVVTSGTYMRTLASQIADKLGTCGLAYSIHRTRIGHYISLSKFFGFWKKIF